MATATTTTTKTTATATITNTTATAATTVTATTATVTVKQHQTSLAKYNSHFISLHLATTVLFFVLSHSATENGKERKRERGECKQAVCLKNLLRHAKAKKSKSKVSSNHSFDYFHFLHKFCETIYCSREIMRCVP